MCVYVYVYDGVCICVYVYAGVYICVYVYVYDGVCICAYVYDGVYICVCMCMCMMVYAYSRRQYKVSVPLKKTRCPTAYQRLKKRNRLPFLRRLYDHNFYAPFSV